MKKIGMNWKKICLAIVLTGLSGIMYLVGSYAYVELVSDDLTSSQTEEVPYHRVGIVLGTNPLAVSPDEGTPTMTIG